VCGRNRNAFGALVRRHSGRVYATSFKMLKNREDTEDYLRNIFYSAHGEIRQYEALMLMTKRRSGALWGLRPRVLF
jgi:DNA-directed RNA polymerase specialized sigma24 family protein